MSAKIDQYVKRGSGNTPAIFVKNGTRSTIKSSRGPFGMIMFLRDTNLTSISSTDISGSTDISSGTTISAGSIFVGKFASVKFSSKACAMLYKWE